MEVLIISACFGAITYYGFLMAQWFDAHSTGKEEQLIKTARQYQQQKEEKTIDVF